MVGYLSLFLPGNLEIPLNIRFNRGQAICLENSSFPADCVVTLKAALVFPPLLREKESQTSSFVSVCGVFSQQEATKRANCRIFSPQRKKKPALVGGLGRVSEQSLPLTKKGKARFVMGDSPQTPPFHRDLSCRSAIVWPIRGF